MNKKLKIFIDSCAWNILYKYDVDLSKELPLDEFDIAMTREVASFEVSSIPESLQSLRRYIEQQIDKCKITVESFFGYVQYNDPPEYKPRSGGFGQGRYVTYEEGEFINQFQVPEGKTKGSGLYNNEADASLAVRACTGAIVLTAEDPDKSGPLKKAAALGGKVIYLRDFDPRSNGLRDFITRAIAHT